MLSKTLKNKSPAPNSVGYQQSSNTANNTKSILPLYLSTSHPPARYPKTKPAAHPMIKKDSVHKRDMSQIGGNISAISSAMTVIYGLPTAIRTMIPAATMIIPNKIITAGRDCSISIFNHALTVTFPYFFLYKTAPPMRCCLFSHLSNQQYER